MRNYNILKTAALALFVASSLAACSTDDLVLDDRYTPSSHHERYPIKVGKGPVKLDVASHKTGLSPTQANTVIAFAQQAASNSYSAVTVSRPSGGGRGAQTARDITTLLIHQGIDPGLIRQRTYPGAASGPVNVSYVRTYAVTKECGDWSESLSLTDQNEVYPNFGCAQQHNIAAMVANPQDFEVPAGMGNAYAKRRVKIINDYGNAASGVQSTQTIAISNAIN